MKSLNNLFAIIIVLLILTFTSIYFISNYINTSISSELQIYDNQAVKSISKIAKNDLGSVFINAENLEDVYFSLGFAHSSDRIWQMELLKLKSQGRISEIFGSNHKNYDLLVRSFDIETEAKKQFQSLDSSTKQYLTAYCNGINLYLEKFESKLPMEFGLNNYQAKKWSQWEPLAIYLYLRLQNSEKFNQEIFFQYLSKNYGENKAKMLYNTLANNRIEELYNTKYVGLNFNANNIFSNILDNFVYRDKFEINSNRIKKDSLKNHFYIFSVVNSNFEIPTLFYECKVNYKELNSITLSIPGVPIFQYVSNESNSASISNQTISPVEITKGSFAHNRDYYYTNNTKTSFVFRTDTLKSRNSLPLVYYKKYANGNSLLFDEKNIDSIFYSLNWAKNIYYDDFCISNSFISNDFDKINSEKLLKIKDFTFLNDKSEQAQNYLLDSTESFSQNQDFITSESRFKKLPFLSKSFNKQIDTILKSFSIESERDLEFVLIDYSSQFALTMIKTLEKNLSNKLSYLNKQEIALYYELKNFDAIFSHKKRQSYLFEKFFEIFLYNSLEDDFDKKTIQYILANKNLLEYTIIGLFQSGTYFLNNKHSVNQNEDLAYILLQSIKDLNREFRKQTNFNRTINFNQIAFPFDSTKLQFSIKSVSLNGTYTSINSKFGLWGSNFRIITDTEKNASYLISSTGYSGDPVSPFFTNLHRLWVNGGFIKTKHQSSSENKVMFEFNP